MLARLADYEAALEDYSRDINGFVEYRLDENGVMTVLGDTAARYRYPDLTRQTEALFGFIRAAVEREFGAELDFLTLFDAARSGAGAVVDMPNRNLDLFVSLCLQGNGRVSREEEALSPKSAMMSLSGWKPRSGIPWK
jgi:hypothetical protein